MGAGVDLGAEAAAWRLRRQTQTAAASRAKDEWAVERPWAATEPEAVGDDNGRVVQRHEEAGHTEAHRDEEGSSDSCDGLEEAEVDADHDRSPEAEVAPGEVGRHRSRDRCETAEGREESRSRRHRARPSEEVAAAERMGGYLADGHEKGRGSGVEAAAEDGCTARPKPTSGDDGQDGQDEEAAASGRGRWGAGVDDGRGDSQVERLGDRTAAPGVDVRTDPEPEEAEAEPGHSG